MTTSRRQGDVAGQQPKGNRIRHGKVKTECLTRLSLSHTHTHTTLAADLVQDAANPLKSSLTFYFPSDFEPPDSSPGLYPSQTLRFLQPLVIKTWGRGRGGEAGGGNGMGGGRLNVPGDSLCFPPLRRRGGITALTLSGQGSQKQSLCRSVITQSGCDRGDGKKLRCRDD